MKWLIALALVPLVALGAIVFLHERGRTVSPDAGSSAQIATISHGETVEIDAHLESGTWTVVEFTADW